MTIYEIDQAIMDCVDAETGEIVDIDALNALEMERDHKISNIACWIKDLKAEAEAVKNEKMALAKRQQTCENKADQLKKYLTYVLAGEKFKDSRVSISYRRSKSVQVADDLNLDDLSDCYLKIKKEPALTVIKEAIESGIDVPGCSLVENTNIQIK